MRTRSFKSSGNSMSSAAFAEAPASAKALAGRSASQGSDEHRAPVGKSAGHVPVLLHEVVENLCIQPGDTVVDATLGGGGHAKAIVEKLGKNGVFVGFDLDESAIERTKQALHDLRKPTIHLVNANFRNLVAELEKLGITSIDKAVFDLGWSGYQLDAGRGFSFLKDEPLSMSYANTSEPSTLTAATIVNEWAEESIADIIFGWGEEHYSRRIAKRIVEARAKSPIRSSLQLAEIIRSAVPPAYRHGRIHPATRTFQALRIAVNDELGALREGLNAAWKMLADGGPSPRQSGLRPREGGRIAVISFHSIEDREVKNLFVSWEKAGEGKRITHSPMRAGSEELIANPRARSAKLRVIEKSAASPRRASSRGPDRSVEIEKNISKQ